MRPWQQVVCNTLSVTGGEMHPSWDTAAMRTSSWTLLTQSQQMTNPVRSMRGTVEASGGQGPFFALIQTDLDDVCRKLTEAGLGLHSVGQRLLGDAEEEDRERLLAARAQQERDKFVDSITPPWLQPPS